MYGKVLVPLDGSKESEGVLAQFQGELAPDGEVLLLKVVPPRKSRAAGGGQVILGSQLEEDDRAEALSYLRGIARQEGKADLWRCESIIADSPAQGVLDFATKQGADLIAMYTHDRKGLAKLFKGSVASEVARRATTEVKLFTDSGAGTYTQTAAAAVGTQAPEGGSANSEERVLRDSDVFKGLSGEQIGRLVPMVERTNFAAGQVVGRSGELGSHIFVIAEGEAQITAHTEVGDIAARVAGPGQSFPLAILSGSGNLVTSVEALSDMEVLRLPRSELVSLCHQDQGMGMRVYMNVADLFIERYGDTLKHLARSVEKELRDID